MKIILIIAMIIGGGLALFGCMRLHGLLNFLQRFEKEQRNR
jgi:hypothetical protein